MTKSEGDEQDPLRCTFADAEHNNLLAGIRMSTHDKVQLFENMLDFAWKTGALQRYRESIGISAPGGTVTELRPRFYLFLDVDGVLHRMAYAPGGQPTLADGEQLLSRLPLLEKTIRPYLQELQIIVSSTWRLHPRNMRILLDAMSKDVRAKVIGSTPRGTRLHDCRPDEIRLWLEQNGEPDVTAIALDDHSKHGWRTNFSEWGIWLQTNPEQAFGDQEAEKLAHILAGQA